MLTCRYVLIGLSGVELSDRAVALGRLAWLSARHLNSCDREYGRIAQRATQALDQGDCFSLCTSAWTSRLLDQVCSDAAVDDAQHMPHGRGMAC